MATVNPVNVPSTPSAATFKGTKEIIKKIIAEQKLSCSYSGKILAPGEATIEHLSGYAVGLRRSPAELREISNRELLMGHTDFVKGINDALAKDAAKKGYKP